MFSSRLPDRLAPNALAACVADARARSRALVDLTVSNPTSVGLPYPPALLAPLGREAGVTYAPEPFGLPSARRAVAAFVSRDGVRVDPDQIVLTASTSEAYSLLFKLLCDDGDDVLVPEPSYPLFDLLTRLDDVRQTPYRLEYHGCWSIDRESLLAACTRRTRVILIVSPNNPTGSRLRRADRDWLVDVARDRGLTLISDEVFIDYPVAPRPDADSLLGESRVLTVTLGGLSKSAGLPQVKLGWMVVGGPEALVGEAMTRLEVICDTYLSVSTPVQLAVQDLLDAGALVREAIGTRVLTNYRVLETAVSAEPGISLLPAEGGWAAVIRVPATSSEEALVLRLVQDAGVLVHPGYFFDFTGGAHLVLSLLPPPDVFADATARVLEAAR
jgi:alanine-synthesizing transaminase